MLIVTVDVMPAGQDLSLHCFTIFVNGVTWEDKIFSFITMIISLTDLNKFASDIATQQLE